VALRARGPGRWPVHSGSLSKLSCQSPAGDSFNSSMTICATLPPPQNLYGGLISRIRHDLYTVSARSSSRQVHLSRLLVARTALPVKKRSFFNIVDDCLLQAPARPLERAGATPRRWRWWDRQRFQDIVGIDDHRIGHAGKLSVPYLNGELRLERVGVADRHLDALGVS